jgi:hypothetical protein
LLEVLLLELDYKCLKEKSKLVRFYSWLRLTNLLLTRDEGAVPQLPSCYAKSLGLDSHMKFQGVSQTGDSHEIDVLAQKKEQKVYSPHISPAVSILHSIFLLQ